MRLAVILLFLIGLMPLEAAERSHPYLFFSKKDLPAMQAKLKDPTISQIYNRVCSRALDYDNVTKKVLCAGLAFHLSGDKKYADAGIKDMMNSLKRGSWFSGGAAVYHCDLHTAKKTLPIAIGYDMFYHQLTEAQRETIRKTISEKVFKPYLEAHANHNEAGGFFTDSRGRKTYWTQCYFNWNHWINGDVGLMGLAMIDESSEAKQVVEAARASLKYTHYEHNQGKVESGGWDEGAMYWGTAMNHSIQFYAALKEVLGTDDGYFSLPGIKMTSQFVLDFTGPDGRWVPFSDCNHRNVIDPGSSVYYLAKEYKRPLDMVYPECYVDKHHALPFALIWRPPGPKVSIPQKRKVAWYKDIHWAVLTNGPTQLAFKGGDMASNHGQFDANSMVVYVGDEMVISDPGYGVRDTKSHNTLLLNNRGQEKRGGPSSRAKGGASAAVAEIELCSELDNGDVYLICNATDCYSGLKLFRRHVIVTTKGLVLVFDEIAAQAASKMTLSWHPATTMRATEEGATLVANKHLLQLATHADQKLQRENSSKALRVHTEAKVPSLRSVTVMAPDYTKRMSLDVSYSGAKVEIECFNKSYVFKMTKNGYQYDAKMKASVASKDKKKRVKKPIAAKPKPKKIELSQEVMKTWQERCQKTLGERIAAGNKPYMQFMGKEYQVTGISDSGTLSMRAGGQQISYPFKNLKTKDLAALTKGMMRGGGEDEKLLAAFFARVNGDLRSAQKIESGLGQKEREDLVALFE